MLVSVEVKLHLLDARRVTRGVACAVLSFAADAVLASADIAFLPPYPVVDIAAVGGGVIDLVAPGVAADAVAADPLAVDIEVGVGYME